MGRGFGEPHVARDDGVEHTEVGAHLFGDLVREIVPRVEHRKQDPFHLEVRVRRALHSVNRRHQVGEPLERVVLALQRHEHSIGHREGVQRQDAK